MGNSAWVSVRGVTFGILGFVTGVAWWVGCSSSSPSASSSGDAGGTVDATRGTKPPIHTGSSSGNGTHREAGPPPPPFQCAFADNAIVCDGLSSKTCSCSGSESCLWSYGGPCNGSCFNTGCATALVEPTANSGIGGLAVGSGFAFTEVFGGSEGAPQGLGEASTTPDPSQTSPVGVIAGGNVPGFVVGGDYLYYQTVTIQSATVFPATLWQRDLAGGTTTSIATFDTGGSNTAVAMAATSSAVYWECTALNGICAYEGGAMSETAGIVNAVALATDGQAFYAMTAELTPYPDYTYAILSQPIAGGAITTLVSSSSGPQMPGSIAVGGGNVFFSAGPSACDRDGGVCPQNVYSVPTSGGAVVTLDAPTTYSAGGVITDDAYVYWCGAAYGINPPNVGILAREPLAGGARETLEAGEVFAVAVDESSVYWIDGENTIWKQTKSP